MEEFDASAHEIEGAPEGESRGHVGSRPASRGPRQCESETRSPWEIDVADRRRPGGVSFCASGAFATVDDDKSPPEENPILPESGQIQNGLLFRIRIVFVNRRSWGAEPWGGWWRRGMWVPTKG